MFAKSRRSYHYHLCLSSWPEPENPIGNTIIFYPPFLCHRSSTLQPETTWTSTSSRRSWRHNLCAGKRSDGRGGITAPPL
ncbi:hypothetical protein ACLB2K_047142 [Fragaria x ananassa]